MVAVRSSVVVTLKTDTNKVNWGPLYGHVDYLQYFILGREEASLSVSLTRYLDFKKFKSSQCARTIMEVVMQASRVLLSKHSEQCTHSPL